MILKREELIKKTATELTEEIKKELPKRASFSILPADFGDFTISFFWREGLFKMRMIARLHVPRRPHRGKINCFIFDNCDEEVVKLVASAVTNLAKKINSPLNIRYPAWYKETKRDIKH